MKTETQSEQARKERCQYEIFVNEYFGLPDNFPEAGWTIDFDYGQIVNLLAMFDEKRNKELSSPRI